GAAIVDTATSQIVGMVVAENRYGTRPTVWLRPLGVVAAPAAPAGPVRAAPPAPRIPTTIKLASAVAQLPTMSTEDGRDQVVGLLPPNIADAVPRHPERRFDVLGIVRTCLEYPDGVDTLA